MGGGLMQLIAHGAQDIYLTSNPSITFWKVTFRRYTNFAMESIEQTFQGQSDFGRRASCIISRSGDLIGRTYLQVTLPQIGQSLGNSGGNVFARWLDFPGHQLISHVEIEIGGQRIDRQYGDWMHIWSQLTLKNDKKNGYYKMIGNTTQLTYLTDPNYADVNGPCGGNAPGNVCTPRKALPETTLYIPLQFWFCRNPGLALPLIALQFHEVKINIDLRPIDECLWAMSSLDATSGSQKVTAAYNQSIVAASLYVDYIFLDQRERGKMSQRPHEYLIEQLQFTGDESVGSSSNKIKLNFNHPCKELVWVVQPDANVDYCASHTGGELLYKVYGAQPFNYSDSVDALPNSLHAFQGATALGTTISGDVFEDATAVRDTVGGVTYTSDAATFVLGESALDMHCWGENPVVVAKLQLNGQDRFSDREGAYFNDVQPYQHHTSSPDTGINVYSFAIRPEEHQPSGTSNFSRIDNAVLQMVLSNATVSGTGTAKVRIYATNYNVLRIMSGMGGLAYAN